MTNYICVQFWLIKVERMTDCLVRYKNQTSFFQCNRKKVICFTRLPSETPAVHMENGNYVIYRAGSTICMINIVIIGLNSIIRSFNKIMMGDIYYRFRKSQDIVCFCLYKHKLSISIQIIQISINYPFNSI